MENERTYLAADVGSRFGSIRGVFCGGDAFWLAFVNLFVCTFGCGVCKSDGVERGNMPFAKR